MREDKAYMKEKEQERLLKLKQIEKNFYQKGIKNICGIDEISKYLNIAKIYF